MEGVQYASGKMLGAIINISRKNKVAGPKWKWCSVVDVSGGKSKVQCIKEQDCIGIWTIRSMNQCKLNAVKQYMAGLNIDISGSGEVK